MSFGIPVRNGLAVGLLASTFLSSRRAAYPAMSLNFLQPYLDSRITFTRATTATFVGSNGFIQSAAINVPRFDYDPVTLAPKGLLIEEARSNLVLRSEQFNDPAWTTGDASISANAVNGPDGNLTADKLVEAATSGVHNVGQIVTVLSATVYTASVYVKAAERTFIALYAGNPGQGTIFNLSNGTVQGSLVAPPTSSSITAAGNGWYRVTITYTSVATATAPSLYLCDNTGQFVYAGDGTSGAYVWGAQLEAGAFATSYIPTVAATVTRNADAASMTGTNFTSWYNATEGSLLVQANPSEAPTTDAVVRYAAVLYETTTFANAIRLERLSGNYRGVKTVAGSSLVASAAWANNLTAKAIFAYKNADSATSFNASTPGLYAAGVPSGIAYLGIGGTHLGGNVWCGHIQQIAYYNTRLPNATLQVLSA